MPSYDRSIALYEETRQHLAGGVSSNVRYASVPVPLFFARGEGARLYDEDGNVHIDYILGNGPAILGHAPPAVCKAVADTLMLGQVFAGQHVRELELSRRLTSLLPSADLVRYASSGTEAVQMAFRIARAFTGRSKIVKFEGHYHGWLDNVYVSVRPSGNEAGPPDAPTAMPDTPGVAPGALADMVICGWNDLDHLKHALESNKGEVAAVIMEPMMVNGGCILPKPGYLEGAKKLCAEHGAVLIFDEVITGFRLGLTGAQGHFGVTPDLTIFAKAVAAGFPMALVAGRRDIMEILLTKGVMHGGTYNGNVQSMAAAIAALDILTADNGAIYKTMEARGTRLMQGLAALATKHKAPMHVTGVPTMFQTMFIAAPPSNWRESSQFDRDRAMAFSRALQEHGVRVNQRASWFFSAAHDDATIEETLAAADRAFAAIA
jgi:glutamate-1-semialdehyde 2,1-aminomutase